MFLALANCAQHSVKFGKSDETYLLFLNLRTSWYALFIANHESGVNDVLTTSALFLAFKIQL